jgi:hypothetical protein
MKQEPLPPGVYTMTIDRVRKVRNKDQKRVHMTILETGTKMSQVIKPDGEMK